MIHSQASTSGTSTLRLHYIDSPRGTHSSVPVIKTQRSTEELLSLYSETDDARIIYGDNIPPALLENKSPPPDNPYEVPLLNRWCKHNELRIIQTAITDHAEPIPHPKQFIRGINFKQAVTSSLTNAQAKLNLQYITFVTNNRDLAKRYAGPNSENALQNQAMYGHYDVKEGVKMGATMHTKIQPFHGESASEADCDHHLYIAPKQKVTVDNALQTPRGTVHAYFTVRTENHHSSFTDKIRSAMSCFHGKTD